MTSVGRHPNIVIGVLLAAVVVLGFVAVVGLGAPPAATDPTPSSASASGRASPSSPPASSIPPPASAGPSMTEIAPGVMADCGRIEPAACERSIALARAGNEADLGGTTLIVVDDTCPPPAGAQITICDRFYPFDAVVVFVTAGGDTTGWFVFHAFGLDGRMPTQAERWQDEIPRHIVDRIRAALATP